MSNFFQKYRNLFFEESDEFELYKNNKKHLSLNRDDDFTLPRKDYNHHPNQNQYYPNKDNNEYQVKEKSIQSQKQDYQESGFNRIHKGKELYKSPITQQNNFENENIPIKNYNVSNKDNISGKKQLSHNGRRILNQDSDYLNEIESEERNIKIKEEKETQRQKLMEERDLQKHMNMNRNENKFHNFKRNLDDINYAENRFHRHTEVRSNYEKALQKRALAKTNKERKEKLKKILSVSTH